MPRRKPAPTRRPLPKRRAIAPVSEEAAGVPDGERLMALRELFWHNVVRELLTSLAVLSQRAEARPEGTSDPATAILDGRLALITASGDRIPIAHVAPLFACGVPGTEIHRALSIAVECTVFQVTAPSGEQYTLPLHEIRGIHALTEELMKQLQEEARAQSGAAAPFGFAAFTSLARAGEEESTPRTGDAWSGPAI